MLDCTSPIDFQSILREPAIDCEGGLHHCDCEGTALSLGWETNGVSPHANATVVKAGKPLRKGTLVPLMCCTALCCMLLVSMGRLLETCAGSQLCADTLDDFQYRNVHGGAALVVFSLFFAVLVSMLSKCASAPSRLCLAYGFPDPNIASYLLTPVLFLLGLTQTAHCLGYTLEVVSPPVTHGFIERPIHTLRYLEWVINVPIILVLSGHVGLGRPLSEVVKPAVITNAYITMSYVALIVTSSVLRVFLVSLSFVLFAWATRDMIQWQFRFSREAPVTLGARKARIFLLWVLILSFAIYGFIYLAAVFGAISSSIESVSFAVLDTFSKACLYVVCVQCREKDYMDSLTHCLVHHDSLIRGSLTLLRSMFDHVLVCDVAEDMKTCTIRANMGTDLRALEALVGGPVDPVFNALCADSRNQASFENYLLGVVQADLRSLSKQRGLASHPERMIWAQEEYKVGDLHVAPMLHCDLGCRGVRQEAYKPFGHGSGCQQEAPRGSVIRVALHAAIAFRRLRLQGEALQVIISLQPLEERLPFVGLGSNVLTQLISPSPVVAFSCTSVSNDSSTRRRQRHMRKPSKDASSITGTLVSCDLEASIQTTTNTYAISATTVDNSVDGRASRNDKPLNVPTTGDVGSQTAQAESLSIGVQTMGLPLTQPGGLPPSLPVADLLRGFEPERKSRHPSSSSSRSRSPSKGSVHSHTQLPLADFQDVPAEMLGLWALLQEEDDVSMWLRFLMIEGSTFVDNLGQTGFLRRRGDGAILCEGGVLGIDGDTLTRTGKSGVQMRFVRFELS